MLNSAILGSEIFLVSVDAQLSRDGTPLALTGPIVSGTIFAYTTLLNSFRKSDFGNYTCTATVRPHPSSSYLTGVDVLSDTLSIKAGKCITTYFSYSVWNLTRMTCVRLSDSNREAAELRDIIGFVTTDTLT